MRYERVYSALFIIKYRLSDNMSAILNGLAVPTMELPTLFYEWTTPGVLFFKYFVFVI